MSEYFGDSSTAISIKLENTELIALIEWHLAQYKIWSEVGRGDEMRLHKVRAEALRDLVCTRMLHDERCG